MHPLSLSPLGIVVRVLLSFLSLSSSVDGFRLYVPRTHPGQNISYAPFEPYEKGFVGYFGQPTNYQRERVNEGAADTATFPRQFDGVHARQVCPSMVGPLGGGKYYCRGKEYGTCDRRSGTCFCEMGYQGIDCGECGPGHFKIGSLCYPKKLCAGDCGGHGTCNYTIGECVCDGGYWGEDCEKLNCKRFDALCDRCSNTTCTTCQEGYSVHKGATATECQPCTRFDPRCSACNDHMCLDCADPLLLSSRRSGYRHTDPGLLWDEATRQLSVALPFGSQDPLAFEDAEPFALVTSPSEPLYERAKTCTQGRSDAYGGERDASWTCHNTTGTHVVCGHRGTVGFASPSYTVSEGNGFLLVTLVRSGGGYGAFEIAYSLEHEGTDEADVTPTAPYTTSQVIPFPEGAVAMTFKVTIHDDRVYEGDERFWLRLVEPTGSSAPITLGPQRTTVITIRDNDQPLTGWVTSRLSSSDYVCIAGRACNFTLDAYSTSGAKQFSGGDLWLVEVTEAFDWSPTGAHHSQHRRAAIATGSMMDLGNGTYRGTWRHDRQGTYALRVYLAVGGGTQKDSDSGGASLPKDGGIYGDYSDGGNWAGGASDPYLSTDARYSGLGANGNGGLLGTYFDSPYLEPGTEAFTRVDAYINFTWGLGRLTRYGTDFASVRWEGAVRPPLSVVSSGSPTKEDYTFMVVCDEGVRLWVDHALIIDQWHAELNGRNVSGTVTLMPGQLHRIILEYRETRRDAFIRLLWASEALGMGSNDDDATDDAYAPHFEVVPQAALFHLYELADTAPLVVAQDSRGGAYGVFDGEDDVYYGPGQGGFYQTRVEGGPGSDVNAFTETAKPRLQVQVLSAATSHAHSEASGPGLFHGVAGREHSFTIKPRDRFGNHRRDEAVEALSRDPFQATAILAEDVGGGYGVTAVRGMVSYDAYRAEFVVKFTPTVSGEYNLNVSHGRDSDEFADFHDYGAPLNDDSWPSLAARHIEGSPFALTVSPAPTFARRSKLYRSTGGAPPKAFDFTNWHVGTVQTFTLEAHDAFDNLRLVGGDNFEVVAYLNRGGAGIDRNGDTLGPDVVLDTSQQQLAEVVYGSVIDHRNGLYTVQMRPIKKGTYTLSVTLAGQSVARSPYKVEVHHGAALASSSVAVGRGLYTARATFPSKFTFQARDAFSNDLESATGGPDHVSWLLEGSITAPGASGAPYEGGTDAVGAPSSGDPSGAASVPITCTAFGNGTALCEYTPRIAGQVLLSVLLRSGGSASDPDAYQHISGSPFTVLVAEGPLDGAASEAYGEGLYRGEAGQVASFTVQARDPWGNLRSNDGRDNGTVYSDGRLDYARENGVGIDPGANDSFNVTLELLSPLSVAHTPSRRGLVYRGGATTFPGQSTYLGNGLHRISYNATARGIYNMTVLAVSRSAGLDEDNLRSDGHSGDGTPILGSPFRPYIGPTSASGAYSSIWGHGLKDSVAGVEQRVHMHLADLYGNNLTSGGDHVKVTISSHAPAFNGSAGPFFGANPSAGPFPLTSDTGDAMRDVSTEAVQDALARSAYRPNVIDFGDGRYGAWYSPLVAGDYVARAHLCQPGGLEGTYFASQSFTRPLETRHDLNLDFDWGMFQYNSLGLGFLPDEPKDVQATATTVASTTELVPPIDRTSDHHIYGDDDDDVTHPVENEATLAKGQNRSYPNGTRWNEGTAPSDYWSARWTGYLLAPSHGEEVTLWVEVGSATDQVAVFLDGRPLIGGKEWVNYLDGNNDVHQQGRGNDRSGGFQIHHNFTVDALARSPMVVSSYGAQSAPHVPELGVTQQEAAEAAAAQRMSDASDLAHEEAREYAELRYAFPEEVPQLSTEALLTTAAVAANKSSSGYSKEAQAYAAAAYATAIAQGSSSEGLQLWATHPYGKSLTEAATAAATATGRTEYSTALLFPRPGDLHTFEVVYRHGTGPASVRVSWASQSLPRQVIPPASFHRPVPISEASYPLKIRPAPTHPPSSTAIGSSLTTARAGLVHTFTIEARDQFGNLRLQGGDVVSCVGVGPGGAHFTADVTDRGDGRYDASYTPLTAGPYSFSVTVGSAGLHYDFGYFNVEESLSAAHVKGSPFQLMVAPGPTYGPSIAAIGEGTRRCAAGSGVSGQGYSFQSPNGVLANASAHASDEAWGAFGASFTLMARDRHHNRRPSGGDAFSVALSPWPSGATDAGLADSSSSGLARAVGTVAEVPLRVELGAVKDRKDGTYEVTYSSARSGWYDLHVRLRPSEDRGLGATYFASPLFLGEPLELSPRERVSSAHEQQQAAAVAGGTQAMSEAFSRPTTTRVEDPPLFDRWTYPNETSDSSNYASDRHMYAQNALARGGRDEVRRLEGPGIKAQSARWEGFVSVPVSEGYAFSLLVHESGNEEGGGARLSVNGELLVSAVAGKGVATAVSAIELEEGHLHAIKLEAWVHQTNDDSIGQDVGAVELWWSSARAGFQQVPSYHLHPPNVVIPASPGEEASQELNTFHARELALLGAHVAGSPFRVYVSPGRAYPAHCVADGPGRRFHDLDAAAKQRTLYAYANASSTLNLRSHDVFGNRLDRGGASWYVRLTFNGPYKRSAAIPSTSVLRLAPRDLGNGSYVVEYTPGSGSSSISGGAFGGSEAESNAAYLSEYRGSLQHDDIEDQPHQSYRDYTFTVELAQSVADVVMGFGAGGSGSERNNSDTSNNNNNNNNKDGLLDVGLAAYYAPGGMGQLLSGGDLTAARAPLERYAEGGGGGGLIAEYFDNPWFSGATATTAGAAAAHVRIDSTVDLALPLGLPLGSPPSPPSGVGVWPGLSAPLTATPRGQAGSGVSVRWSGYLKAPATANFSLALDLGALFGSSSAGSLQLPPGAPTASARLYLDDGFLLARDSAEEAQGNTDISPSSSTSTSKGSAASASVYGGLSQAWAMLQEGVLYKVRVEYSLRAGEGTNLAQFTKLPPARCRLLWWAETSPRNVVPAFFLWPRATPIDGAPLPLKVFF